jgi:hypothetical protein
MIFIYDKSIKIEILRGTDGNLSLGVSKHIFALSFQLKAL